MTSDQQSAGRKPRRFRLGRASGVRVAAVGSALCLAAGMGMSMATQASAAPRPGPGGFQEHHGVLPVCISFGGILRLALPFSTCNGPIVPLEIAGFDDHEHQQQSGIDTHVHVGAPVTITTLAGGSGEAFCAHDEVATGGGYTVTGAATGTAYDVATNAPTTDGGLSGPGDQPNDWMATLTNVVLGTATSLTLTPYVVCTDEAQNHHAPMAPAHPAARH